MGLIKKTLFLVFILLCSVFCVGAQEPTANTASLDSELARLEAAVKNASDSEQRHAALRTSAQLYFMAGKLEEASAAWTEAAFARSGTRDDEALLEAAVCFIMLGEFDKAMADISSVLLSSRNPALQIRARFLGAQLEALRGGQGALNALKTLVDDPDFTGKQAALLYMLYHLSGDATYAVAIREKHPRSPEAKLLNGQQASLYPVPLWFLPAERSQLSFASSQPLVPSYEKTENTVQESDPASTAAEQEAGLLGLQVGLFKTRANAETQLQRLSSSGFPGSLVQRSVNEEAYWAVLVPVSADVNTMIIRLKDAGFESFPVFN